jgi:hypothetical protein
MECGNIAEGTKKMPPSLVAAHSKEPASLSLLLVRGLARLFCHLISPRAFDRAFCRFTTRFKSAIFRQGRAGDLCTTILAGSGLGTPEMEILVAHRFLCSLPGYRTLRQNRYPESN